jgi:hypothetical protein
MTDRAQPGAISSLLRNDELAQALDSFTQGGIVSGSNPTDASIRRSDIDETALDAFSLSSSASSLDVTVAPGEAFLGGWVCRDTSTTLTLPANATTDIVIAHATDAIFDPAVDPDRDAADEVIVDLAGNVAGDIPQVVSHQVETDGSGVTSASRVATVGGFSRIDSGNIKTQNITVNGTATGIETLIDVQTEADLPPVDPPQIAFIQDKNEYQRSVNKDVFSLSEASVEQSISTEDASSQGVAFSDDGSKLFEVGASSGNIFESTLSSPFDLGTASLQQSISAQDNIPSGITFSNDGTAMFVIGRASDLIYQSALSNPFDLSTANFQKSISTQDANPRGLVFSDDGTALFEIGLDQNLIYKSTLSSPFDLGTASFQQSIPTQDNSPQGIDISKDGRSIFEIGKGSGLVYQSELSTSLDLSTATFNQSIATNTGNATGLSFSSDGKKFLEVGNQNNEIIQSQSSVAAGFKTF